MRDSGNARANVMARELGYQDAETLKADWIDGPGSRWDLYLDKTTRRMWLRLNQNGQWQPTDLYAG